MSYSIASSPTLLDHPNTFDDVDATNYRDFRLVDEDLHRIDPSSTPTQVAPPPYPEQYPYFSDDGDGHSTNITI
ncbi:hypothetical protein NMY22_g13486 [Coprinellus aureogranulatus]|nr:hypothetical protein NMY22_g13486 [Coprinellus aureogranulatus]